MLVTFGSQLNLVGSHREPGGRERERGRREKVREIKKREGEGWRGRPGEERREKERKRERRGWEECELRGVREEDTVLTDISCPLSCAVSP